MLWIEDGRAFAEASAVMKAASYLGGFWSLLAGLASIFPSTILNPLYRTLSLDTVVCCAIRASAFESLPQNSFVDFSSSEKHR